MWLSERKWRGKISLGFSEHLAKLLSGDLRWTFIQLFFLSVFFFFFLLLFTVFFSSTLFLCSNPMWVIKRIFKVTNGDVPVKRNYYWSACNKFFVTKIKKIITKNSLGQDEIWFFFFYYTMCRNDFNLW